MILFMHCFRQKGEGMDVSDSSDADDIDRLGEKLFSLVERIDAAHANDITGTHVAFLLMMG